MEHYVGIDVSLEESSVCMVDATGTIVREVKVASEPEALVQYFDELELSVDPHWARGRAIVAVAPCRACGRRTRCGFARDTACEGGALGYDGEDRPERCTRDRPTAANGMVPPGSCQIGDLPRIAGPFLVGRKLLQGKLLDVELSIRGILRGYGLKVGDVSRGAFRGAYPAN